MASDKSSLKPGIFVIESSDFSSESLHANARIIGANVANNRNFSGKVYRGKRNEPAFVSEVAKAVAEIKGISAEEVDRITEANALEFFGIK
jgi:Tat protein secretion system quality control protein TatD with DNase activity